ncbi:hypothetical protein BJ875DRAFT_488551 [Amylocarpus encephaloides]|uniref:Uncharacterized protein n=1 Tax=Amylocarpus encephaloides TaxID=45428 RepID=A0A9P7YA03_9HELO|nr:hypothetical protein BJ875DRAFT_488551 [Amylocarpus encephaloides]
MNSLYQVLFLVVPFLASCASAASHKSGQVHNTTELEFTFPKPGRFDYEFTEGDKAIVEWEPEIKLSEVYLNCSSTQTFNGQAERGEIQFINAYSGSLYLPNWDPDMGDNTFCTFCAGPDAKTCSGVFHLVGRKNDSKPKVWSSTGTVAPRPERNDSCSCTSSKTTPSRYTVPSSSTAFASAQRSATPSLGLLPYPSKNSSAPYYNATSLAPTTAIPTTVTAAGSPTMTGPYTTITPRPVGWNDTNTNSTGVKTIVQTIAVPPTTFNPSTASRVPPPATPTPTSGTTWNSNVNSALLSLLVVGAGAFIML